MFSFTAEIFDNSEATLNWCYLESSDFLYPFQAGLVLPLYVKCYLSSHVVIDFFWLMD